MANVVLKFDSREKQETSLEVYRDISMVGAAIPTIGEPDIADYMEFLRLENAFTSDISAVIAERRMERDPYDVIALARDTTYAAAKARYESWKKSSKYNVGKLVNVKAVQNSLHQIFTWIPGERVINPEFGSNIRKYLYEGITDQNIEAITAEIHHCVSEWEPRVVIDRVVNVQQVEDTENNTVRLDIYYHIKGLDGEQFMYSYNYYKRPI